MICAGGRARTRLDRPGLRSTGVAYDVRKAHPYLVYDRFDFDVPVGTKGDNYDRFMCASRRSASRCASSSRRSSRSRDGPIDIDDPRIVLPPKDEVYTTIEGTISTSRSIIEGIKVPAGEVYSLHRGRQRRARLLPRLRRHRPPLPRAASARPASPSSRRCRSSSRTNDRRRRPHLRLAEHDRRRVRPLMADTPTQPAAPPKHGDAQDRRPDGDRRPRAPTSSRRRARPASTSATSATTPGLSSPAVCRQCLVEVKGQPKLVPSCYTPVADNMEVLTQSRRRWRRASRCWSSRSSTTPSTAPSATRRASARCRRLYQEWDSAPLAHRSTTRCTSPRAKDLGPHIVSTPSAASCARAASASATRWRTTTSSSMR